MSENATTNAAATFRGNPIQNFAPNYIYKIDPCSCNVVSRSTTTATIEKSTNPADKQGQRAKTGYNWVVISNCICSETEQQVSVLYEIWRSEHSTSERQQPQ